MERMGWGGQPYIVFKHTDIGREHIHIVSVQVAQDGRKINDSRRNERSVAVTEELEREYGLHPAKGRRREKGQGIVPADYTRGDLKRQVAAVIKPAVATYRFQTLGEFRALLSLYNTCPRNKRLPDGTGNGSGIPHDGGKYNISIIIHLLNFTVMQQEDDLRGLAKTMDFMRALSILFVVINIYWFCYGQIREWGINIGVVDRILLNFDRRTRLSTY